MRLIQLVEDVVPELAKERLAACGEGDQPAEISCCRSKRPQLLSLMREALYRNLACHKLVM